MLFTFFVMAVAMLVEDKQAENVKRESYTSDD